MSAENTGVNATQNHVWLFLVQTISARCTNGQTKLDAMKNRTNNCYVDDSQQIHKYNTLLIKEQDKNKHMFIQSKELEQCTRYVLTELETFRKSLSKFHPIESRNRAFGTKLKEIRAYIDATSRPRDLFNDKQKIKILKRNGHTNGSKRINKKDIILDLIQYPSNYLTNEN